jgi:WD40-like Beta Propeller Repeat
VASTRVIRSVQLMLPCALLVACSGPVSVPHEPSTSASTDEQTPSFDGIPSGRPTPTTTSPPPEASPPPFHCSYPTVSPPDATSDGPLESGLYVAFFVNQPASAALVIKSTQGATARTIPIPPDASLPQPEGEVGISPDGRYFVYFTGGPTWLQTTAPSQPDLTLHIARAADGEVASSIPLLRSSLIADIDSSALALAQHPPPGSEGASSSEIAAGLWDALLAGITTVAWSPDARYLAFSGAIEGPSSDVYVYDTTNGQVRRLTSGPEEIVKIAWSPDGEWIMHGSATWVGMGSFLTNHAVRVDGSAVVSFTFGGSYDRGWLTNSRYLVNEGANGIGSFDLAILDIDTGRRISVWPQDFGALAFDRAGSRLLLGSFGEAADAPAAGLYLLNLATGASTLLDGSPLWNVSYWPSSSYQFAAARLEDALYGVTSEGVLVRLLEGDWNVDVAPDLSALALSRHGHEQGLYILNDPTNQPRVLDEREAYGVRWSPDSTWILYYAGPLSLSEDRVLSVIHRSGASPTLLQILPWGMCLSTEPTWIVVP